ncbi:hypothetical protein IW261DRAFT_1494927 [Armillaria novae-zelandiae]|uniref:Uncharacterized protein n=1 Tax=Armillaria novae-zelandiae TaxID=153914 RepID=A0AA39P0Z1_9AGAR|nr:hypothetical protein IW261DRAFT_1494927 [Armillaria novae-zelandiae]
MSSIRKHSVQLPWAGPLLVLLSLRDLHNYCGDVWPLIHHDVATPQDFLVDIFHGITVGATQAVRLYTRRNMLTRGSTILQQIDVFCNFNKFTSHSM